MITECPRCKIEMTDGISIDGTDSRPDNSLSGPRCLSNHKTIKLTKVLKCHSCGYSINDH